MKATTTEVSRISILKPVQKLPVQHPANNRINHFDRSFHDWYRFVLSFPPHLVRDYIRKFDLGKKAVILDPFCGTGTTIVESKLNKFRAIGIEANPFAHFASSVKTDWLINPDDLEFTASIVAKKAYTQLLTEGIDDDKHLTSKVSSYVLRQIDDERASLLLSNSISPIPLHKALTLLEFISEFKNAPVYKYLLIAFSKALVFRISNLKFGPEVGVSHQKGDTTVIAPWLEEITSIVNDIRSIQGDEFPQSTIILGDSRDVSSLLKPKSIDAVITSPPYPNEKDYSRTTRLESVLLGFINSKDELRNFKKTFIRSNTRGVYVADKDDEWISDNRKIRKIANEIERRRIEQGKTSGFEKLYARVSKLYFGGMARHLENLKGVLKPDAHLAYVVGDQASYLRVMIRTGQILAEIAEDRGYEVVNIDLFRTRFATATGEQLREEVVHLRWNGKE